MVICHAGAANIKTSMHGNASGNKGVLKRAAFKRQALTVREECLHMLQGCEVSFVLHQVLHIALCKGTYPGLRVLYCAA